MIENIIEKLGAAWLIDKLVGLRKKYPLYVNMTFLEKSPIKQKLEAQGYKLRWTNEDKIEQRKMEGWEIVYTGWLKNRFLKIRSSPEDQVLMRKKQ